MSDSASKLGPIGESDKIQQILAALQNFIIDGDLEHGTELPPERELAQQLGVSRFSLREALRVAQAQGLLDISRGVRPRVAKPSADAAATVIALSLRRSKRKLLDLVAARQALESQIARHATSRATERDLAEMQATIAAIERDPDNAIACVDYDIEFHNIILRASGNLVFEIMLAPLAELLRESRLATIKRGVDHVIVGHTAVLEAMRVRDPELASAAMHEHLELAESDLLALESQ